MNSPEQTSPTKPRLARAVSRNARRRAATGPGRSGNRETIEESPRRLDGFAVARICSAFQLQRADHFPAGMDEPAFAMLVDLFLSEWLGQRAGAVQCCGMHLDGAAQASSGIYKLADAGLVAVTPPDEPAGAATITLSEAGRARLNSYFDRMASYIAAI